MAANNVKKAFRLPSGVNEDFIRNLMWQHQQQKQQENINQQRDSSTGVFLWNYEEHVFLSNIFGRLLLEEHKILLKTVPIAIPYDISKAYYQKGFVICFLRLTYGRFMEFLIETYNKGFSCSWIFSASWALPNA